MGSNLKNSRCRSKFHLYSVSVQASHGSIHVNSVNNVTFKMDLLPFLFCFQMGVHILCYVDTKFYLFYFTLFTIFCPRLLDFPKTKPVIKVKHYIYWDYSKE